MVVLLHINLETTTVGETAMPVEEAYTVVGRRRRLQRVPRCTVVYAHVAVRVVAVFNPASGLRFE